jgi:hypothetical protein
MSVRGAYSRHGLGLASLGWTIVRSLRMRARRVSLDLLRGFHLRHFVWLWQWAEAEGWAGRSNEILWSDVKRENEGGTCSNDFGTFHRPVWELLSGVRCLDTAFARSGWCGVLIIIHTLVPLSSPHPPLLL